MSHQVWLFFVSCFFGSSLSTRKLRSARPGMFMTVPVMAAETWLRWGLRVIQLRGINLTVGISMEVSWAFHRFPKSWWYPEIIQSRPWFSWFWGDWKTSVNLHEYAMNDGFNVFYVFFQTIGHTSLSSSAYFDHFSSCSCHFSWAVKRHNSTRCDIRKCEKQIWQWVKADGFVMICPQGGFAPNLSHCWRGKWSLEHLQTQICGVAGKILHAQHEHAGIRRGRKEDTAAIFCRKKCIVSVSSVASCWKKNCGWVIQTSHGISWNIP